ncbi:hypothetical protein ACFL0I_04260 [Gemmatimonadota bacterium]
MKWNPGSGMGVEEFRRPQRGFLGGSVAETNHLLTLWNPSYASDAMDEHLRVLIDWAGRAQAGEADSDEVYVWWGKIRSPNRKGALPHADTILALDEQVQSDAETHLYLTDYRSLYVAWIGEITAAHLPKEQPDELDHMPSYYRDQFADFWFQLWDIRRLVADDTPAVIEELKRLRNIRYHDRPVSLYGGMVELPLIVTREDGISWFSDRDLLTDGQLWAQRESELKGETERMAKELRDNLLGQDIWGSLEPATRTFLASAEAVFRARKNDPAFDFSGPAMEYAKAVETELNALLFPAMQKALSGHREADRSVLLGDGPLDLGKRVPPQGLGTIQLMLDKKPLVASAVRKALPADGDWILGELPHKLRRIIDLRNPAAHSRTCTRDQVQARRQEILGIGHEGIIVKLARAKLRS